MSRFTQVRQLLAMTRVPIWVLVSMFVAAAFVEGTALLLLVPLLGAAGLDVQEGAVGRLSRLVTSAFALVQVTPTLTLVLVIFVGVTALQAWLRRTQLVLGTTMEREVVHAVRTSLYDAICRMQWLAFSRLRGSDLNVALTSEADRVGMVAAQGVSIAGSIVVTAVYVVLAFRISPGMTATVVVCGGLLALLARRRGRQSKQLGSHLSDAVRSYQGIVMDDLAGMKAIRSFAGTARSYARFTEASERIGRIQSQSTINYANGNLGLEIGSAAMLSGLVAFSLGWLGLNASALFLLLFLFARVVPRLSVLQQNIQFFNHVLPSFERSQTLLAQCLAAATPDTATPRPLPPAQNIGLERVSFRYAHDRPPALDTVTLAVKAGTMVGVVGSSGAGKTTLVDVLLGLLTPDAGTVTYGGAPLTESQSDAWRSLLAYVPQDTFLFHDTIRANLTWAAPAATEDDVWRALEEAAATFVRALPEGLDTVVGDRGMRLSGGERQRLALARALLRRPSLLILDEATSALDLETESLIVDTIRRLRGHLTIVVVTHRLSSVMSADEIHVLERGAVVESGSWDDLMRRADGRLRSLVFTRGLELSAPA